MRQIDEQERKRIGELITTIRKEKGLTQLELAEQSGLGRSHIVHIEKGDYNVRLDTLSIIAKTLECEITLKKKPKRRRKNL